MDTPRIASAPPIRTRKAHMMHPRRNVRRIARRSVTIPRHLAFNDGKMRSPLRVTSFTPQFHRLCKIK
jgi:hypothetical protein